MLKNYTYLKKNIVTRSRIIIAHNMYVIISYCFYKYI